MRNSPPLPQSNCQHQENGLETDTLVREPHKGEIWPGGALWLAGVPLSSGGD